MNASSVILLSLVTSVAAATGTVYAIERFELLPPTASPAPPRAPQLKAPQLTGLSEQDARNNLTGLGLVLTIEGREPSAEAEAGHVIRQSVPPSSPVENGSSIGVTLAKALPRVPSAVGLSPDRASVLLARAGYKLEQGAGVVDPNIPIGQVAKQTPSADTELAKDSVVSIHLSIQPEPVKVPVLVGLGLEAAKLKLSELGLRVGGVAWMNVPDRQAFIVMNQAPEPGKRLEPNGEVKLFVNR